MKPSAEDAHNQMILISTFKKWLRLSCKHIIILLLCLDMVQ